MVPSLLVPFMAMAPVAQAPFSTRTEPMAMVPS